MQAVLPTYVPAPRQVGEGSHFWGLSGNCAALVGARMLLNSCRPGQSSAGRQAAGPSCLAASDTRLLDSCPACQPSKLPGSGVCATGRVQKAGCVVRTVQPAQQVPGSASSSSASRSQVLPTAAQQVPGSASSGSAGVGLCQQQVCQLLPAAVLLAAAQQASGSASSSSRRWRMSSMAASV